MGLLPKAAKVRAGKSDLIGQDLHRASRSALNRLRGDRITTTAVSGVRGNTRDITLPEQLSVAREDRSWVFRRVLSPPDPQQKPIERTETIYEPVAGGAPRIRSVMASKASFAGIHCS